MTFYEKNNVTENYLHEVRNHLLMENSLSAELVDEIIRESGLISCVEGCPYIAMHYPENYGGVIALSSLIDPFAKMDQDFVRERGGPELDDPDGHQKYAAVFGGPDRFYNSEFDLYACMRELNGKQCAKPRFLMLCGDNDFLLQQNRSFAETAAALPGIDLTYEESPGIHNWDFWDSAIVRGLQFFGIK